jgi:hypothetical protein
MNVRNLFLAASAVFLIACGNNAQPGQENDIIEEDTIALEIYGDTTLTADGAVPANELLAMLNGNDSVIAKVQGEVLGVCKKKGCWMDIDLGNGKNMTVRFKDYGFFVPMNSESRTAIMSGVAKVDTQSVEWLRHKAFDAGKSQDEIDAITEPVVKVTFMADGVIMQ